MINSNLFFSQFQVNYFDYKQSSLEYLLSNFPKVGVENQILDYKEKDYINAIRCDIRQTFFQAIETVFEVFFALMPDKKGRINQRIIERITLSDLPYNKINKLIEYEDSLDFLDLEMEYSNKIPVKLGEFIFYFGLHDQEKFKNDIKESLESIKYALRILAGEFSDRREYNSYKHGLRIIPALQTLSFLNADTMEQTKNWDLNDSMTFYSYDKKTQETSYITKVFDSDRDIRLTTICSNLLWLMIKLRDASFNKSDKEKDREVAILFFSKDKIIEAAKTDVKIQNISISQSPIKK
jgi:hypothetical protein